MMPYSDKGPDIDMLRRMVQFAAAYPDERIVVSLIRQLSWTHFIALIPLKDPLQRDYYAQMASAERWSVRTLRERIDSMLYERTALSKNKAAMLVKGAVPKPEDAVSAGDAIKDPYVLEFLNLKDEYSESDLEEALIAKLGSFLLELGGDFAFVGFKSMCWQSIY